MAYSNLGITEATPFDPAQTNVWATTVNTNMTLIDNAIAGILSLDVSGSSNVVLTATAGTVNQFRNATFVFTGVLTGDVVVLWPAGVTFNCTVANATTGAFALSVGANNGSGLAAGTTVGVLRGTAVYVSSDGTNMVAPLLVSVPTRQTLTSGTAATYTTPTSPVPRQLRIRMWGGAAAGAANSNLGNDGGNGVDTSFNSVVAKGGFGGRSNGSGGIGGTGGTGAASLRIPGNSGIDGVGIGVGFGSSSGNGGAGVPGPLGGGTRYGLSPAANTGASGPGGAGSSFNGTTGGSGGGPEYVELIINIPAATYSYTVGTGGVAPSSGVFGFGTNGASGQIIVDELY